MIEQE